MSTSPLKLSPVEVDAGLRAWARGIYPMEAGVEVLIRTGLAHRGDVQLHYMGPTGNRGMVYVDTDVVEGDWREHGGPQGGGWSGGERRLLAIALSLIASEAPVSLTNVLPGIDDDNFAIILAAFLHTHDGTGFPR